MSSSTTEQQQVKHRQPVDQVAQLTEYLTKKCGFNLKEEQLNKIENILNKNKKKKRDENAPKPPATAFFLYLNANRQAWKEAYPDQSTTELATGLGERWRNASEETKAKFQQASEELRKAYNEAKVKYDTECQTESKEVVPSTTSVDSIVASTETPKKVKQNKKLDSPSEQPSEPKKKKTSTSTTSVVGSKDESKVEVHTSVAEASTSEVVSLETPKVVVAAPKKKKVVKETPVVANFQCGTEH